MQIFYKKSEIKSPPKITRRAQRKHYFISAFQENSLYQILILILFIQLSQEPPKWREHIGELPPVDKCS